MADTGVEAAEAVGESTENIPEIELIIKASTIDGRRKGACLFCQVRFSSNKKMKIERTDHLTPGVLHGSLLAC